MWYVCQFPQSLSLIHILLVSSLIALSPACIRLHRRDCLKESTYRLLEDIFGKEIMA